MWMELLNDTSQVLLLVVLRLCSAALVLLKKVLAQRVLLSRLGLQEGDCFTFVSPSFQGHPATRSVYTSEVLKTPNNIPTHSLAAFSPKDMRMLQGDETQNLISNLRRYFMTETPGSTHVHEKGQKPQPLTCVHGPEVQAFGVGTVPVPT